MTEDLRDGFVNEAPKGFLTMYQAMRLLGVSRQYSRLSRARMMRARGTGSMAQPHCCTYCTGVTVSKGPCCADQLG